MESIREKAFKVACDCMRVYVERGDDIDDISKSYMGVGCLEYSMQVGGYCNRVKLTRWQVGVDCVDGKKVHEIFLLKDIYRHILTEKKQARLFK